MSLEDPYEGQKFTSFDVLKKYLEDYGKKNFVKFWIRSSHTIGSLKSKSTRKMNPDLKYVCMKFACIFGGEKIRHRGSGIRKSTTYRNLGCPCMINAVVGEDGNHVKLETVVLEHNHVLCKSLYDSLKKSKNKIRMLQKDVALNQNSLLKKNVVPECVESSDSTTFKNSQPVINENDSGGQCDEGDVELQNENSATCLPIKQNKNFQDYLKKIQSKYGNNVKIIVVSEEEQKRKRSHENIANADEHLMCEKVSADDASSNVTHLSDDVPGTFQNVLGSSEKNICRLCLSASNKLTPIFKPSLPIESTILSFKIMSCASIEVRSDDELPSSICSMCEEILDIAYNFRMRCENSDSILRKACLSNRFVDANHVSSGYSYSSKIDSWPKMEEPCDAMGIPDKEVNCDIVKNENELFFELNIDMNPSTQNEVYAKFDETCPICGNIFDSYGEMLRHMKEHRDIENFLLTCNLCSVICTTVKSLMEHMKEHMVDVNNGWAEQSLECSQCELNFSIPEDAKSHEGIHESKKVEQLYLETHSDKTNNSASGYLCNVCGKILKSKDRFQSHRNTHEGLRPHICLKCGRGFADRKNMHQHYDIVHLRKAKHECPICHKKFYAPTKMKSHITMHYGVKPFSCDVCNKTFRLRMNMIKHKKTHSNEKPHKCDKCNAAFIDKNLLTRHSYVHGGERPHVCPFCGHRFTVKFNLKKHIVSGKCNGRSKGKEASGEYPVDEWVAAVSTESEPNLHGNECIIKCEPNEMDQFAQEHESMQLNILPDFGEK